MSVARRLAVQLCAAGRPALYKLQQKQQLLPNSAVIPGDAEANFRQIHIPLGQSGIRQVGEDAVFINNNNSLSSSPTVVGFGVADGVGGWRDQGVDPGLVSMALMSACSEAASSQGESLKVALGNAHRGLLASRPELVGSTTVCLARVTPSTRLLEIANLGDSGLCLLEGGGDYRVKLKTRFQTNMGGVFNCPMQLAFPVKLSRDYPKPEDCELYSATMELGDIVLVATDGLWDNLYPETIQEIFKHAFKAEPTSSANEAVQQSPLEAAASLLVDTATYLSAQQDYASPFCQSAAEAGLKYSGGKEDDISVVLAMLCQVDGAEAPESGPKAKL